MLVCKWMMSLRMRFISLQRFQKIMKKRNISVLISTVVKLWFDIRILIILMNHFCCAYNFLKIAKIYILSPLNK